MATAKLLKSKETKSREDLAAFLEALAVRVRDGQLAFQQGAGELVVRLPETLRVDLELSDSVKPARRKRELEIEIWWEIDGQGEPNETGPSASGVVLV